MPTACIPTDLRDSRDPRITVTRASRTHAYISVDGKGIATVADLDYFDAILSAVEEKVCPMPMGAQFQRR